jgi:O-antigen/teichoic acid export membrane protein
MTDNQKKRTSFPGLILALSTSTGIQVTIQVISIPIFLRYLTITEYSVWIIATNLAQISTLLDLGSLSSIQNRFTFLGRLNDEAQVKKIIAQFWNILAITHVTTIAIGFALLVITDLPIKLALIFLLSSFLQIIFGLYEALTRMRGHIPKGLAMSNILRLSEFSGYLLALLFLPVSITYIAVSGLMLKLVTFCVLYSRIEHHNRFIELNKIDYKILLDSIREGYPFLIIRISDFIMLSGVLIVLQNQLNPLEIVAFSAARTFFRLGLQVTNLYNHAFGYQMSESWAEGNFIEMKKLIRKSLGVNLIVSCFGAMVYLSMGKTLFEFWTRDSIDLNQSIFLIGAVYSLTLSINQGQKVKFNSTNSNLRVSYILLFMAILQVTFTVIFGGILDLEDFFLSLILNEVLCLVAVMISNKDVIARRFRFPKD